MKFRVCYFIVEKGSLLTGGESLTKEIEAESAHSAMHKISALHPEHVCTFSEIIKIEE